MQADLANGNVDAAKTAAEEASKVDPTAKPVTERVFANYYSLKAQAAQTAGKYDDAAALFEQGALVAPTQAASLYASAATSYLKVTPNPDDDKAGAMADKALAVDANNAQANYAKGVALANQNKKTDALTFLGKADTLAKAAGLPDLATSAENAIKQLNGGK
jgi:tetratricopeptide (TPR) repeat protein